MLLIDSCPVGGGVFRSTYRDVPSWVPNDAPRWALPPHMQDVQMYLPLFTPSTPRLVREGVGQVRPFSLLLPESG